jgi:3-(3-hydroxy-phenyl)propionate hydroxylase
MSHCDPPIVTDAVIVGLGPVGVALANLLGRYGVKALAFDQATNVYPKPRAIALDNEALRILQWAGVRHGELDIVALPRIRYHSPLFGWFARINTAAVVDGHPMQVSFYQPQLESMLRDKLKSYPCIDVRLGLALHSFEEQADSVTAKLVDVHGRLTEVKCRYFIGADGASSQVRKKLGLEFQGKSFEQDWLIIDAKNVPNGIDDCVLYCNSQRPSPHLAAPGGRHRWEFMLQPGETGDRMVQPDMIRQLLAPWCSADGIEIERTAVYRFHAREAKAFSKGRCFLVGDAAHVTPPFAGQGLVAGLRDVANLAWKIAWVLRGQASEAILASYDTERRPHARKIINLARISGMIIMPSNRFVAFCVHGFLASLRLLPPARAYFEELKIKPPQTFGRGFFKRNPEHKKLLAGSVFPQAWVRPSWTGQPMLSDDVLGQQWALIAFGLNPRAYCDPELLDRWHQFGARTWQFCYLGQALNLDHDDSRVECLDDTFLPKRVPVGWACIVRPDRCVFSEGPVETIRTLLEHAMVSMKSG